MACTAPTLTMESSSPVEFTASGRSDRNISALRCRRRHSYDVPYTARATVCSPEAVIVRFDLFLLELKKRLDRVERYKQEKKLRLDTQLERGYQSLKDIRDSCSPYSSGELWGAAKLRAANAVQMLENGFNDVVSTKETFEQKAQASMQLMDTWLSDLETRVTTRRRELIDSSWRKVDDSINATLDLFEDGYDKAVRASTVVTDSIANALKLAAESRLIKYDDLPVAWQCNPYITRGYRFTESKFECMISVFKPSNETVNIWSHAIGLFVVLAIAFVYYPASEAFPMSSKWDIFIAACFFAAACKCLICSCMWHTMNSIADKCLMERFACVDYTGISLLVASSILSTEWTAFYCEPVSRSVYMSMTLILGLAGTILPWKESFNRPDMSWARVAFYVTLALTGFAPVVQLSLTRGAAWTYYFYAPITKSMLVYGTGAVIYASRVPEKWAPGLFDYAGGSHNIWHLAVLGGILFHYTAMQEFFQGAFLRSFDVGGCAVR